MSVTDVLEVFGLDDYIPSAIWGLLEKLDVMDYLPTSLVEFIEDMELHEVISIAVVLLVAAFSLAYLWIQRTASVSKEPPKIEETPTPSPGGAIVTALSPSKLVFRLQWPPEPDEDIPPPTRTFVGPGGATRFAKYMVGGVVNLKGNEEWESVKSIINETEFPVLVALVAKWSKPSQSMVPKVLEVSQEYAQSVIFVKADVNEVQAAADECGTDRGLPVFQLWHKGKCVGEVVGTNEDELEEMVDEYVARLD